jgi:phosphohistidine phosphatase
MHAMHVMPRRLVVLRHAESDREARGQADHTRPLDDRGRRDAPKIGARLGALGWAPEVVISSDATRTQQTWACMEPVLGGAPTVTFTRTLYLMGIAEIRAALAALAPAVGTVMVIGHNPGWEDAVHELCGVRVRMGTCDAALLSVAAATWPEAVARGDWAFEALLRPDEG